MTIDVMRYRLSFLVPVRFKSTYGAESSRWRSVWWQWRGRVWAHRKTCLG